MDRLLNQRTSSGHLLRENWQDLLVSSCKSTIPKARVSDGLLPGGWVNAGETQMVLRFTSGPFGAVS